VKQVLTRLAGIPARCHVHPEVITGTADLRAVQSALASFYRHRPAEHCESTDSRDCGHYAELIASHASRGAHVLDLRPGSYLSPLALHEQGFDVDACDMLDESFMAEQISPSAAARSALGCTRWLLTPS